MKLNIFTISLLLIALIIGAVWYSIKYAFSPEKCPKCGSLMNSRFDERNMEYEYECPNCGHEEKLKI